MPAFITTRMMPDGDSMVGGRSDKPSPPSVVTGVHTLTPDELRAALGGDERRAGQVLARLRGSVPRGAHACEAWALLAAEVLAPSLPFALHKLLFEANYKFYDEATHGPAPAWFPSSSQSSSFAHSSSESLFIIYISPISAFKDTAYYTLLLII